MFPSIGQFFARLFSSSRRNQGCYYINGPETRAPDQGGGPGAENIRQGVPSGSLSPQPAVAVYIAKVQPGASVVISIGTIGLIKAVGTYQPAKSIKLATYASRCIENEILMYLRKIAAQKSELSFDEPLNTDRDGNELLLSDVLGTESDLVMRPIEADVDRQLLRQALERLEPREKQIITLRFGLDGRQERTQKEVADQLGISQSYISRLEKRIIHRLRRDLEKAG
ncbi:MAG: sigma-70 family RNA polymerase sigma factor [Acutalibacter sp.]